MRQGTPANNSGLKIIIGVAAIFLTLVAGLIFLIITIASISGGSSASSTSAGAACTPGDTSSSGVVIPPEYEDYIAAAASESRFSPGVIAAQLEHESGFDPNAESPAGAKGIAQFMGPAWETFGNGGDIWNPEDAIAAQGRYMAYLRDFMDDHARDE